MNIIGKKILITGSSGFIGKCLTAELTRQKAIVDQFDINIQLDITDNKKLSQFVKNKYFAIYHLAGFSGSSASNSETKKTVDVNLIATANLIELIVKNSPNTKLIVSGSRLEYGTPKYLPVDENHPANPSSTYGISKLAATQLALIYAKTSSLRTTIFRTSNVYGPHPQTKFKGFNVINHFIDLARKNKELIIFGNGEQVRDYIFIDDLVRAFILALQTKADGQIYNLGFGLPIKFKDMAQIIVKTVKKGKLKYTPWPDDYKSVETGDYVSDINKISTQLNFRPKVDFKEGIKKTFQESL